eukprot:PhF_6_TR22471/c0_g1_i1/m.31863
MLSHVVISRTSIGHIVFVNLDATPNFFHWLEHLGSSSILHPEVFFWLFTSSPAQQAKAVGASRLFWLLVEKSRVEVDCQSKHDTHRPDNVDVAMAFIVGEKNSAMLQSVRFTVVGAKAHNHEQSRNSFRDVEWYEALDDQTTMEVDMVRKFVARLGCGSVAVQNACDDGENISMRKLNYIAERKRELDEEDQPYGDDNNDTAEKTFEI